MVGNVIALIIVALTFSFDGVLLNKDKTLIIVYPAGNMESLYTIPNGVTSIEMRAFSYCKGLTTVTIPESVTSIGDSAFSDCSSLESITIPESVTSIGDSAFYNCLNLTSVTVPDSFTSIGDFAFYNCLKLSSMTLSENVESIGYYAFYESGLHSIEIKNSNCQIYSSAETIPSYITIYGYENSTAQTYAQQYSMTFKDLSKYSIETEGSENLTYSNCGDYIEITDCKDTATTVIIPAEIEGLPVTSIGEGAFYECTALISLTIPDTVTSIGRSAFYDCSGLISLKIPESVTSIGDGAFCGCSNLKSLIIPNSITNIGESTFYLCSSLESVTIPDSVTSIGDFAFYNCSNLESVIIPNDVASIGDYAFYRCLKLNSVLIPSSIISIGNAAFYDCSDLKSILIENTECEIYSDENTISDSATIYGYANSTAQTYAETYGRKFDLIENYSEFTTGDIDENGTIDAIDASSALSAYARVSTGQDIGLTDNQKSAADVNGDGVVDAVDASGILTYYAKVSTGGSASWS